MAEFNNPSFSKTSSRKWSYITAVTVVATTLMSFSATCFANLLLNGDFGQPTLPLGDSVTYQNETIGNWNYGVSGATLISVASGSVNATPSQGCGCAQVVGINAFDSLIYQYFTPTVSGEYAATWQDAGSATPFGLSSIGGDESYTINIRDSSLNNIASSTLLTTPDSSFASESLDADLTGGQQYFIGFVGEDYGGGTALISNVSVDLVQADAPEPSALSIFGVALGFLLLLSRRAFGRTNEV